MSSNKNTVSKTWRRLALAVLAVALLALQASAAAAKPPEDFLQAKPESVEAWKDMRFGMFICWGPVTLTGYEIGWSRGKEVPIEEYDSLYRVWNPDRFDARQWVKVARETGAKYIVFLTKHHDGFCLWDTKQTDYNVMNSPLKRDVMRELSEACREQKIALFPYYSTCDWHHPDFPVTSPGGTVERPVSNLDRYTEYLEAQVKELILGYGPLLGIWFDVPQRFDRARGERIIRYVRSLQPDILVNNRTGAPGDFDTPEQKVGRFDNHRPWESCITLGTQWAWKPNDELKPYTDAVQMLVACAAGDGNLALNTNPMPDGRIEPRQVEIFRQIGSWLAKYGESIYGTRGGPFVAPSGDIPTRAKGGRFTLPEGGWWGGSTRKDNVIYLHILRWPQDMLYLPAIPRTVVKASVLTGGAVTMRQTAAGLQVSIPPAQRDAIDTIVKLELDGPAREIPVIKGPSGSLAFGKRATASDFFQTSPKSSPDRAFDDDFDTRWSCDWGPPHSCWLEVDLGEPKTFDRALISDGRVQEYELQVWENDNWRTFYRGTTIKEDTVLRFDPVTGQRVRLNLIKTTERPSIREFQLFEPGK